MPPSSNAFAKKLRPLLKSFRCTRGVCRPRIESTRSIVIAPTIKLAPLAMQVRCFNQVHASLFWVSHFCLPPCLHLIPSVNPFLAIPSGDNIPDLDVKLQSFTRQ